MRWVCPGIGTVQTIVYLGPRFPDGRPESIGLGIWPIAAGKNPLRSVTCPRVVFMKSPERSFSVLLKPGPEIDASDGFVKAYRALGRFRRGAELRPWLLRIVANEARNRRRSAVRRERLTLRAATEDRPGDAVPSPEAALLTREAQEQLLAAVERLSDDHRDAVVCRYLLDLSEAETATALGIRRGTVKSRLSRALEQLREELET